MARLDQPTGTIKTELVALQAGPGAQRRFWMMEQ